MAIVCIVLALGTLPSIYLISSGLLNNAVALSERTHFQMKLAVHISEIVVLGALSTVLMKGRRS